MKELLLICYEFMKTGLFAVGGGMATLPFLTRMQQTYQWFTAEELANMIAVSESTPGPIGVNMATYVGFSSGDVLGALCATLSLVFPSVVVSILVARTLERFRKSSLVKNMFAFMRPAVAGLIAAASLEVLRIALFRAGTDGLTVSWLSMGIFAVLLAAMQWKPMKKIHPVAYIAVGAVLGVVLKM